MDWGAINDGARRWGRGAAALALLAGLWLLLGPRDEGAAPAALSGPGLGVAAGAGTAGAPDGRGSASAASGTDKPKIKRYVVHVAGAVRHPGVYRVRAPGRLIDAVKRAGGLTADADLMQVNLAARLTDGRQIIVPRAAVGGAAGVGVGGDGAATAPVEGAKVSLNAASAEQLDTLDGVGPAMAAAIIELRTKLGGFTAIDQLDDVSGVGEKRLASLRAQVEL